MRARELVIWCWSAVLLMHGCSVGTNDGTGSASIGALTSADVDRVEVTIDGTAFAETLSRDPVSGNFEPVVISDIPVGDYTFRAQAYDDGVSPAELLYEGTADATITEGAQAGVIIVLQQVPPADEFDNTVPIFQSLVYTPANPRTDEVVTLTATVSDPDVGDVVSLSWTAPGGGSLADANADGAPFDLPSVDWTAPSSEGTYPVTIEASDQSGATATLTANIGVSLRLGSAEVTIDLNTWPEVSNLVPDPTRIDVGESTTLTLTASDENGDDLAYAWSATGCAGIFSDDTAASPSFQLTDAQGNTECTLSVGITDVDTVTALPRGGSNTASVTIATGPEVVPVGITDLSCTFSTSGSAINSYHVDPLLDGTIPFGGAVDIDCEAAAGGEWSCSAAFANVMGPYTLAGLGELCIVPMPADYCDRGVISCDAGTDQNVVLEQRHDISNESIAGRPAPPRSCASNADCRADCEAYCGSKGAVRVANSPACEGFCRQSGVAMCLPDYYIGSPNPALVACEPDDTCDESVYTDTEISTGHDGFCGCQCLSVGDGNLASPGEALLNLGYRYYILLPGDYTGTDGPCTADDVPSITIPPVCIPYTTSTASVNIPDAAYAPPVGFTVPIDSAINPPPATGMPFACVDGAPQATPGVRLQGVFASKDTTNWDEANQVTITCE